MALNPRCRLHRNGSDGYCRHMSEILIIEDDARVRSALARALTENGHAVGTEARGMDGLHTAVSAQPAVVVLDLGLPDVDGVEVLRMLRAVSNVPVVVVTARDEESDIVRALDTGADDYLVKPFSAAQLAARIRAVLRRSEFDDGPDVLTLGALELDQARRTATLDRKTLDLSRKEFELLRYLMERAGTVVTRRDLLADIWQLPYSTTDKTLDVHLSWLRRKLGETAQKPVYLHTVRGVGVRLDEPGRAE